MTCEKALEIIKLAISQGDEKKAAAAYFQSPLSFEDFRKAEIQGLKLRYGLSENRVYTEACLKWYRVKL